MKIVFFVNYGFYPLSEENKRVSAVVSVRIPKERGTNSIPLYYCGKIGDCEIYLDKGIDTGSGDSKEFYAEFYAESPEELDRKINCALEQYRQQVLLNIATTKKIKDRVIPMDFPDPYDSLEPDC
jgi:hypothetical protein